LRQLASHEAKGRPSAQKGARQVDVDCLSPAFNGHLIDQPRRWKNTGVVEQQVKPLPTMLQRLKEAVNITLSRDVSRDQQRLRFKPLRRLL
jgi:hypothetical protein